ncbi:hypothetical protein M011DRAFT_292853 [Sporormia fimetaria CBS 119925]|uniref:Zn(2)-C6 fungal-type domain-containing protein n=1 Tax=Sporormia fimetaria CBS 119925 TaxID=1340428 RepID=A0A6A6UXQ3_9PLEO|nr:hypothetical protein M011DRAFT_292853 [Sporormia fimetaria CBS 119925]
MDRGTQPTSGVESRPSLAPAAMLAVDMNRPPSMPSRPAPPYPPSASEPFHGHGVAPSQPDMYPPRQYHRPREPDGGPSNAQQLPSLRTLLQLDTKSSVSTPLSSGAPPPYGASVPYDSSSPVLKRRHDFEGHGHGHIESNAIASRTPQSQHHAQPPSASVAPSLAYPASAPLPGQRPMDSFQGSFGTPLHRDTFGAYHRPSTVATGHSSDLSRSAGGKSMHDDAMDIARPLRRRTESSSRAPVRAPRCLGQREIPGEGLCYVYEDGSYCRAVIDGEPVNPSWGITKAGKPRKRLAQACLTCREKKIKCEPGYPKCHQCAKSQRVCRGGLSSYGISNASGETSPSSSAVLFKNPATELVSPVAGPNKSRALDEQRDLSRTTEAWTNTFAYSRPRTFRPPGVPNTRDMSVHSADSDWSGSVNHGDLEDSRRSSHQDAFAFQWEEDPYQSDPRGTMQLLELYFLHAGRVTYTMFASQPFLRWVESQRDKNRDQLMLLYSTLAVGSVFSTDPEHRELGRRYAAVAAYATEKRFGRFTLQLCQSRLLLALYSFATGREQEAWDFCGAGLRALAALKLNTEEGIKELLDSAVESDYGFDPRTFEECCRRTFWSGFLMDVSSTVCTATTTLDLIRRQRYNGFCGGTLCVISIEDVFLRLPGSDTLYEGCAPGESPLFDFDLLGQQARLGYPLGNMAYLILVSAVWGDVLTFTRRASHRSDVGYEQFYDSFYNKMCERLEVWRNRLPPNLQSTPQNLETSIVEGTAGAYLALHALYHITVIKLNRHIRNQALSADKVARNIDASFRSASSFLATIHQLTSANHQGRIASSSASQVLFSSPFPGYALMLAVDVITATGTVPTLPNLIETIGTTVSYMDDLAVFWASARKQQKAIGDRLKLLVEVARQEEQGVRNGSFGQFWRLPESLDSSFGEEDVMYKANDQVLFEVVGRLTGQ